MTGIRLFGRWVLVAVGMAALSHSALAQSSPSQVEVFKADGSLQCQATSGTSLDQMAKELTAARIPVVSMREANDGLVHIALCGAPTGSINVFRVDAAAVEKAKSLGFGYPAPTGTP